MTGLSRPSSTNAATGKALVRRLVDEVMNQGRLEVLDELCTPATARRARAWIEPFLQSFRQLQLTAGAASC